MERIIFTSAHTLTHQQPPIPTIIIIIIMSDENDEKVLFKPEILSTAKVHSGYLHRIKHYSPCNKCHMTFAIYIPSDEDDFPVGNGGVRKNATHPLPERINVRRHQRLAKRQRV